MVLPNQGKVQVKDVPKPKDNSPEPKLHVTMNDVKKRHPRRNTKRITTKIPIKPVNKSKEKLTVEKTQKKKSTPTEEVVPP